jgi:retinol dehydrogenase-12
MGNTISQTFPPKPKFIESSIPDLQGKVYIVTGASAGVGKELARILYSRNGTVYVAARSVDKASAAIAWIQQSHPDSQGTLHFLKLDLNDLEGIKPSAEEFLSKEKRLDVLFNNAGVMVPPKGSTTKQGYELQLGTNCVAPFLFTKLLTPLIVQTAKTSPAGEVRVVWVSSGAVEIGAPKGGLDVQNLDYKVDKASWEKYSISKGGNILHAVEYARRYREEGIISIVSLPCSLDRKVHSFQRTDASNSRSTPEIFEAISSAT